MSGSTPAVTTRRANEKKTGKKGDVIPTTAERRVKKSDRGEHDKPALAATVAPPSPQEEKRIKREKRPREEGDAEVLHGSFVVADLPTNMAAIYTRTVRHLLPPQQQKCISEAEIMEETDGATLTFEVANREVAVAMFKRLQNIKLYGRRWKVQYYPLHTVQCGRAACLADVRLVPAAPRALALRALSGVQGFLTLADVTGGTTTTPLKDTNDNTEVQRDEVDDAPHAFHATAPGDVVECVVASFVDEGSALHARALLSGRLIGSSGVRMFVERHR